ncbi:MAG: VWA domain-containing protein, partial [Acidobacteriota bacterium]|nr:VWA domain-containing protein [Acidobacteriota bacterium]
MRMRKWIYTALLLIGFAALMPGFLQSQQDGAPDAKISAAADDAAAFEEELPVYRIGVDVSMVSVPVTVRNADGSFYRGLTQKSFRLREDGKEQEIVFFAEEGLPTYVAMVLDISGSVQPGWGAIKYSTKRFLEQLRPDDSFSIITFNNEISLKMDWGRKTDRVDAVLTSIYCKDNTKLWDAIWVAATQGFA